MAKEIYCGETPEVIVEMTDKGWTHVTYPMLAELLSEESPIVATSKDNLLFVKAFMDDSNIPTI